MEPNKSFPALRQFSFFALFSIVSVFLFHQCTDDPLNIDPNDILPDNDMLDVVVDSIPVELYTVGLNAIETRSVGYSPLGSVMDATFGLIEADFITDFMYTDEVSFKNDMNPDSLDVLDLKVLLVYEIPGNDDVFGDSSQIDFNIYELLDPVPNYTKSDYRIFPHMIGTQPLNEGVPVMDNKLRRITVNIRNDFANRLIDTTLIGQDIYEFYNQSSFKNHFKGFYFKVTPRTTPGGGIITVNHDSSMLILRTTHWTNGVLDTNTSYFNLGDPSPPRSSVDSGGAHLNMYRYALSSNLNQILNDTVNLRQYAFIHSLIGPQVYVKIPSLAAIRDSLSNAVSVNRAQLILPFDSAFYVNNIDLYSVPSRLGLYDSKTQTYITDDIFNTESNAAGHLGGLIDRSGYRYTLNMENHIHNYLRNENNPGSSSFYLFAASGPPSTLLKYHTSRIVLNNSGSSRPPYLRIIYSIIPK